MTEFNPEPRTRLVIGGQTYEVMPHPSVPTFAFGQEGRKAFVYQVAGSGPDGRRYYALKKFKQAFRLPDLVKTCKALAKYAALPGMEACERECLHHGAHDDALGQYPDLEFAVLMPWIKGSTWYDIVVTKKPLRRPDALTFAHATAEALAGLEQAGLAHCDISAPNVIINPEVGQAHLIDVEDLYAKGFNRPSALPSGTEGYAHKTAADGLWQADADRFAGAVMLAEMAAWHSPEIREESQEEHFFGADEMQTDSLRYQLMRSVLGQTHAPLADLFDRAWFSDSLEECATLGEWLDALTTAHVNEGRARIAPEWRPIATVPAPAPETAAPAQVGPASSDLPRKAEKPATKKKAKSGEQPPASVPIQPAPAGGPALTPRPIQSGAGKPTSKPGFTPIAPPPSSGPVAEWRPLDVPAPALAPEQDRQPIDLPGTGELLRPVLALSFVDREGRPHLVWSESTGADRYILQESEDRLFDSPSEFTIRADETRWNPEEARAGQMYYRVRAQGDNASSDWSDVLRVMI